MALTIALNSAILESKIPSLLEDAFHGHLLKRFKISLTSLLEDALLVSHRGN
jgi:hypothetical protein